MPPPEPLKAPALPSYADLATAGRQEGCPTAHCVFDGPLASILLLLLRAALAARRTGRPAILAGDFQG